MYYFPVPVVFDMYMRRLAQLVAGSVFLCNCLLIFMAQCCPSPRNLSSNELTTVTKDTFKGLVSLEYL